MKALLIYGGWEGHEPRAVSKVLASALKKRKDSVTLSDTLASLDKISDLRKYDVIIPHWTCGQMSSKQSQNLQKAILGGVGLAGCHGGMGDSMRGDLSFQWMVGGQFVGHPHVGDYPVHVIDPLHPITAGLPKSFDYNSEQYYMLVDPSVNVLAETPYAYDGRTITHPVTWTKPWGKGRVFYCALGHAAKEFKTYKPALEMIVRGICWAGGML